MRRALAASVALVMTLCLCCSGGAAAGGSPEPRVPVGNDPGGVAIALIGRGVDYTAADIAARLARDGEGELIGWDFIDDDRRPYESGGSTGTALARIVAAEAPTARLAIFRLGPSPGITLGRAAGYAGQSPARIVLAPPLSDEAGSWEPFRRAAAHFKDRLFIVPAGDKGFDLGRSSAAITGLSGLDNVIVVAAADASGRLVSGSNTGAQTIDIAAGIGSDTAGLAAAPSEVAAARIAALAARLTAGDTTLAGGALKGKILGLASHSGTPAQTRAGWLANPG
jgi:hypothetical protein